MERNSTAPLTNVSVSVCKLLWVHISFVFVSFLPKCWIIKGSMVRDSNPAYIFSWHVRFLILLHWRWKLVTTQFNWFTSCYRLGISDIINNSAILGGEFSKIRNVELRKLPVFEDFFVNAALVLALREFKTGRKQHEPKERNLKFPKLFSGWKNIDFQEN